MKTTLGITGFIALMLLADVLDRRAPPPPAPAPTYFAMVCAHYQSIGQGWKCQ